MQCAPIKAGWLGMVLMLAGALVPASGETVTQKPSGGPSAAQAQKKPATAPKKKPPAGPAVKRPPAARPPAAKKPAETKKPVAAKAAGKKPASATRATAAAPARRKPAVAADGRASARGTASRPATAVRSKPAEPRRKPPATAASVPMAVKRAESVDTLPSEATVPPEPAPVVGLGSEISAGFVTPMMPVLGFGGAGAAAAACVDLASIAAAPERPRLPTPSAQASPLPSHPFGDVPTPPPGDAPASPPPGPPPSFADTGPSTVPKAAPANGNPAGKPAVKDPPNEATPAAPPPEEIPKSAVVTTSEPPAASPSPAATPPPREKTLSGAAKAIVAPVATRKIPFSPDDEPLVKTALGAATPETAAAPRRMSQPLAADELAPKPPEKKGAAYAVPAAAGDLLIAANSQTDFQVKDRRIVFTGNIVMKNERFYLTADTLVAYMKENEGGLDFAEAQGNVVVRMISNGQETGSSGLSKTAIFHPRTGEIVLRGWPQVRFGNKAHIASSATTEMSLFTDGRMKTTGRNQTMIVPAQ